jgi:hypothetical protein
MEDAPMRNLFFSLFISAFIFPISVDAQGLSNDQGVEFMGLMNLYGAENPDGPIIDPIYGEDSFYLFDPATGQGEYVDKDYVQNLLVEKGYAEQVQEIWPGEAIAGITHSPSASTTPSDDNQNTQETAGLSNDQNTKFGELMNDYYKKTFNPISIDPVAGEDSFYIFDPATGQSDYVDKDYIQSLLVEEGYAEQVQEIWPGEAIAGIETAEKPPAELPVTQPGYPEPPVTQPGYPEEPVKVVKPTDPSGSTPSVDPVDDFDKITHNDHARLDNLLGLYQAENPNGAIIDPIYGEDRYYKWDPITQSGEYLSQDQLKAFLSDQGYQDEVATLYPGEAIAGITQSPSASTTPSDDNQKNEETVGLSNDQNTKFGELMNDYYKKTFNPISIDPVAGEDSFYIFDPATGQSDYVDKDYIQSLLVEEGYAEQVQEIWPGEEIAGIETAEKPPAELPVTQPGYPEEPVRVVKPTDPSGSTPSVDPVDDFDKITHNDHARLDNLLGLYQAENPNGAIIDPIYGENRYYKWDPITQSGEYLSLDQLKAFLSDQGYQDEVAALYPEDVTEPVVSTGDPLLDKFNQLGHGYKVALTERGEYALTRDNWGRPIKMNDEDVDDLLKSSGVVKNIAATNNAANVTQDNLRPFDDIEANVDKMVEKVYNKKIRGISTFNRIRK